MVQELAKVAELAEKIDTGICLSGDNNSSRILHAQIQYVCPNIFRLVDDRNSAQRLSN